MNDLSERNKQCQSEKDYKILKSAIVLLALLVCAIALYEGGLMLIDAAGSAMDRQDRVEQTRDTELAKEMRGHE